MDMDFEDLPQDFLDVMNNDIDLNQKITQYSYEFNYFSPNIIDVVDKNDFVEFNIKKYINGDEIVSTTIFNKNNYEPISISKDEEKYLKQK